MKYFAPATLRVEKDAIVRVKRILRGKGQFRVKVGQEVSPSEIIGSAALSAGFRILNLASLLSISPQDVKKYLVKKIGDRIYQDELLAYKRAWLLMGKKVITSPTDGTLDFLNERTGELRINLLPRKRDLPAGVYGVIEEVDEEKGEVVVRTEASLIHGVFGSGKLREGILHVLGKKDSLVSKEAIVSDYEGYVLVGGSLFHKDTVSHAISNEVSGLITGGLNAEDYRGMDSGRLVFPKRLDTDIGLSVVVCEGFGSIPIGSDIFKILSEYEGKFVFIDGNKALITLPSFSSSSLVKIKKTHLPAVQNAPDNLTEERENRELKQGLFVRVVGNSYLGEQGKVLAINDSLTLLPSGVRSVLATIETARRKIQVPVANLEVIV